MGRSIEKAYEFSSSLAFNWSPQSHQSRPGASGSENVTVMSGFYSLYSKQEECCHNGESKGLGCKRLSTLKNCSLFRIILQGHREAHAQKRQQFRRINDQIREGLPFLFSTLCVWGFQIERWSCPGIGCFLENATLPLASHSCLPDIVHQEPLPRCSREARAAESLGRKLAAGRVWEKAQTSLHPLQSSAKEFAPADCLHNEVHGAD